MGGGVEGGIVMPWGPQGVLGAGSREGPSTVPVLRREPRRVQRRTTWRLVAHISEQTPTFGLDPLFVGARAKFDADCEKDGHAAPGPLFLLLQSDRGCWLILKKGKFWTEVKLNIWT